MVRRLVRALAALLLACPAAGGAQAVARIDNTATLSWSVGGVTRQVASNTVSIELATREQTALSFLEPPAGAMPQDATCRMAPSPQLAPAAVDAAMLASARPIAAQDAGAPVLIRLDDRAGNHDPATRETEMVMLAAAAMQIAVPLTETAVDSGIFAGALPALGDNAAFKGCDLALGDEPRVEVHFPGNEYSRPASATLLIDPLGYVFDSRTGEPVDGATVSLVDPAGRPATVFGEDGHSRYPATVVSGAAVSDDGGRNYPAIRGRYRFPLVPPGTYALKVTPPGDYHAPSTRPREEVAKLPVPIGRAVMLNEASYGGTLVLADERPFTADVPLDRDEDAAILLTKTASVREAAPGDVIQYRLAWQDRNVSGAEALVLHDVLPPGLSYRRGSTRGAPEPRVAADGRTLDFALDSLPPRAARELSYVVTVAPGAPAGEALNRARLTGAASVGSNEAMASVRLRPLLFTDAFTVIGRVTEGACGDPASGRKGVAGIRLLLEDGTFVVTDRDGLYHIEGVRAGRHVVQLDTGSVPASHAPVACDSDTRQAGSAISRFVEGIGGTLKRVDFQLRRTGKVAAATDALPIAVADDATAAGNRDWMQGLTPGTDWLFPLADHNPRSPAQRVVVKHPAGTRVALTIDGDAPDALAFDGSDGDGRGTEVSRWTGVPLHPGDNRLVARVLDAGGRTVATLERIVHYSGVAVRATFDPQKSRLIADGLTRPLIAVRVTDAAGRPVRSGTAVPFRLDAPYAAASEVMLEQARQLSGTPRAATSAQVVGDGGYAFVALQPTTQAGAGLLHIDLVEEKQVRTSEVRAWLAPAAKAWTVVGFGAGSIGYDMLSKHARGLPHAQRDGVVTDGQLAFYAKGRVRGQWLLTIAYDSDRRYDPDRGLLGTIDPDRYYTVYGDGTQQGYDAATRRKLYLRLERREAYALFGDFETGFADAQLTRYSRTLSGVKAAYEGQRVRATGFAATTDTLYRRDEIQGNGLSGPYRLSARGIVPNSDRLSIQVRDRFRSELIVSQTQLTRHIDYDIDVSLGTIRFREPVLSRDAALNPRFIVVDYEVEGGRGGKLAAAARVAARVGAAEIGVAAIRDDTVGHATVLGADIKAKLGAATELRGEVAGGGPGGVGRGLAYLAEVEHYGGGLDLLAYARQQDAAFGVGQQNLVEAGTRKIGLDGRVAITSRLSLTGTGWYQEQLTGPGSRIAGDARLEYRRDTGTLFAGAQIASDRGIDGRDRDSRLLTLGGSRALFGGALTLSGQTQVAPGGDKASIDFPVRHQINVAWRVKPGIRLLAGYDIADGAAFTAHTAQVGFDVAPWRGGKLMSTLNQQGIGENGARTFAQYGLSQSLPLGKRWSVDATLDASSTVSGRIPAGGVVNAFQPVASGGFLGQDQTNGDYLAVTLGASFHAARWTWNGRLERRTADAGDRWGLTTNFLRTLGEGRTLAASVKAYASTTAAGATAAYLAGDVALAWRPLDSRWSVLERLALRYEHADAGVTGGNVLGVPAYTGAEQVTTRLINNLALNYRSGPEGLGQGTEASVYYGAKYVRGRFADDTYDGFIDVVGVDLRQDIRQRVDIGVAGSVQHAWKPGAWAWSGGPSVGVSPAANVWMSAGYNVAGYRDRDFEDDRYTRAGPYLTMRLKFDQRSLGDLGRRITGVRL